MVSASTEFPLEALASSLSRLGMDRADAVEALGYMQPAIDFARPDLFASYVTWKCDLEESRDARAAVARRVARFRELESEIATPLRGGWSSAVDAALTSLEDSAQASPEDELRNSAQGDLAGAYLDALLGGDRRAATDMVLSAVDSGLPIRDLYIDVFQPVLAEIGRRWETRKMTVGQEHYGTAVTLSIMAQLFPRIVAEKQNGRRLVATSVSDNLHEVGIRMVTDIFELEGWDTYFLGANTPLESVLAALRERNADVLALSVTLSSQICNAAETIAMLRREPALSNVKVLVGGRAFSNEPELATEVGADGWSGDASSALRVAEALVHRGDA